MPTDWLSGDNPAVLLTCLLTVGAATAVMYFSAELGGRNRQLAVDANTSDAVIEPQNQNSSHEQAA